MNHEYISDLVVVGRAAAALAPTLLSRYQCVCVRARACLPAVAAAAVAAAAATGTAPGMAPGGERGNEGSDGDGDGGGRDGDREGCDG